MIFEEHEIKRNDEIAYFARLLGVWDTIRVSDLEAETLNGEVFVWVKRGITELPGIKTILGTCIVISHTVCLSQSFY